MTSLRTIAASFAIVAALILPSISYAEFFTGVDLKKFADSDDRMVSGNHKSIDNLYSSELRGYILGVYDAVEGISICLPDKVTATQLTGMVKKYLRDNPDKWNYSGKVIVINALSKTFPCKN
jgi:hypothetical protein